MSASRRSGVGPAAVGLAVCGLALAGCSTTQDKSAALQRRAKAVDAPGKVALGRPDPAVRVVGRKEVRTKAGTAVVVELQNTGPRALLRVPVALRLQAGGKQTYSNDGEGGDELLLRVPVLPPRGRVTWVNSNVPATTTDAKLEVIVGAPTRRSRRPAAALRVSAVKRSTEDSGEDGVAVTGVVHNDLRREQTEVPVYVTTRDGDELVAAAATRIDTIAPRSSATFEAVLVGDGRRGRLAAEALPTKLQKTTRSSR
ncbi:hypothetical protein [Patulibacter minatonensis]|uniref:hypothetical protein n=1 Tax=Patulibacter minatonensis TaxID=298163 RepID=UPI00047D40A9|nr:hypothetical protein [Patulibacter minatonensis]